jgi:hypothetical protein
LTVCRRGRVRHAGDGSLSTQGMLGQDFDVARPDLEAAGLMTSFLRSTM